MIPSNITIVGAEIETTAPVQPSLTYYLDKGTGRIMKKIDDVESLRQHIEKTLECERYEYSIYSPYYGSELHTLLGKDFELILAELPRMIKEALQEDDRIRSIHSFEINPKNKDEIHVSFIVDSVFGQINYETEGRFNGK